MAAHVYVCAVYGTAAAARADGDASAHIAHIVSPPPLSLMVSCHILMYVSSQVIPRTLPAAQLARAPHQRWKQLTG
eukprot:CAMPEP_0181190120 /NCGR_PEP_ID=MMETSP1096-20121128/12020_1 /TAXON_ID=156174 ORGANISM="Chrysochromulina ericina, Strain CCMP281" /NCGR_SAMPLE_ID=MMETSP1096 /ASSEMBLY_ACC=CAM_ASM_000453 /LENGTH=75 /DNA_ID=CAMNT_0023279307 /DNA_START=58 /DNA_END=285 /DNA_ORIENTATION=+